ncbi:LOW QUALITY PROTEIN: uncharacterized protein LOC132921741 [Rhopalosiphum padi]|uniref:LOW QUALITY PROTEIN: uncharacterized protein LOC132921741 n=1 Tax=Rhopalosiphum padi TaxID=40932 RepID=UPI00298D6B96|nr:LOW QUALITY PROTEIN: uncharacterized protein LOC132921741 [Rhopalosiphum padi]
MYKCLVISLIVFLIFANSDSYKPLFLPNLPFGEYRINYLGLVRCVSIPNKIAFNLYLSKKTANTTEIKGNITNYIPFDDSFNFEFNMAIKDSIGGWKDNALLYKRPKACSSLKMFLGNVWAPIMESAGILNATCPIPVGFYKVSGIDTANFASSNVPKTFFYGVYKFRFFFTKKQEVYGCFILIIELKRSWETD